MLREQDEDGVGGVYFAGCGGEACVAGDCEVERSGIAEGGDGAAWAVDLYAATGGGVEYGDDGARRAVDMPDGRYGFGEADGDWRSTGKGLKPLGRDATYEVVSSVGLAVAGGCAAGCADAVAGCVGGG